MVPASNYTATNFNQGSHFPCAQPYANTHVRTHTHLGFHGSSSSMPVMRQQHRHSSAKTSVIPSEGNFATGLFQSAWNVASDWVGSIGFPGADAAATPGSSPAMSVHELLLSSRKDFQIRMSMEVDRNGDLLGHVVAVGIDGTHKAYKTRSLINSLDFERGDLVLVEGIQSHCDTWKLLGIPKENCIPIDAENPGLIHSAAQTEKKFANEIKSTAQAIYDALPSNFFDQFGYRFNLANMDLDHLLDFIGNYESKVKPEARQEIKLQVAQMDEAGKNFNDSKIAIAIERQHRMANMAKRYKRPDRTVVMILACDNAVGVAPRLYEQNDIVMVDRVAANSKPAAQLPQPLKQRTDL